MRRLSSLSYRPNDCKQSSLSDAGISESFVQIRSKSCPSRNWALPDHADEGSCAFTLDTHPIPGRSYECVAAVKVLQACDAIRGSIYQFFTKERGLCHGQSIFQQNLHQRLIVLISHSTSEHAAVTLGPTIQSLH